MSSSVELRRSALRFSATTRASAAIESSIRGCEPERARDLVRREPERAADEDVTPEPARAARSESAPRRRSRRPRRRPGSGRSRTIVSRSISTGIATTGETMTRTSPAALGPRREVAQRAHDVRLAELWVHVVEDSHTACSARTALDGERRQAQARVAVEAACRRPDVRDRPPAASATRAARARLFVRHDVDDGHARPERRLELRDETALSIGTSCASALHRHAEHLVEARLPLGELLDARPRGASSCRRFSLASGSPWTTLFATMSLRILSSTGSTSKTPVRPDEPGRAALHAALAERRP